MSLLSLISLLSSRKESSSSLLSCCHVEASALALVDDVAVVVLALVLDYLGENGFEVLL